MGVVQFIFFMVFAWAVCCEGHSSDVQKLGLKNDRQHDKLSRTLYQYLIHSDTVEDILLQMGEKRFSKEEAKRFLATHLARQVPHSPHILSRILENNDRFRESTVSLRANAAPRAVLKASIMGMPNPSYAPHWDATSATAEPNKLCRDIAAKYRSDCLGSL